MTRKRSTILSALFSAPPPCLMPSSVAPPLPASTRCRSSASSHFDDPSSYSTRARMPWHLRTRPRPRGVRTVSPSPISIPSAMRRTRTRRRAALSGCSLPLRSWNSSSLPASGLTPASSSSPPATGLARASSSSPPANGLTSTTPCCSLASSPSNGLASCGFTPALSTVAWPTPSKSPLSTFAAARRRSTSHSSRLSPCSMSRSPPTCTVRLPKASSTSAPVIVSSPFGERALRSANHSSREPVNTKNRRRGFENMLGCSGFLTR
mmetsp:Transcript_37238/g.109123  ORF Transcript_37238/g.109123 Transcript_37238/m.109123 type:complete len:265 (+) Transcript_37238:2441-3235(+)